MCNLSKCWETHTHTHTHTHTRKLLHSFLHSFPVMEGFCASRPQGDSSADLLFGKRGGSAQGKWRRLLPPFFISGINGKILHSLVNCAPGQSFHVFNASSRLPGTEQRFLGSTGGSDEAAMRINPLQKLSQHTICTKSKLRLSYFALKTWLLWSQNVW